MTAVANEFAKMRRLRLTPIVLLFVFAVTGMSVLTTVSDPDFAALRSDPSGTAWQGLLGGLGFSMPFVAPLLLAVLASRQVDMEHQGSGWLACATNDLSPKRLVRAKFLALAMILAGTLIVQNVVVWGFGALAGISAAAPAGQWLGYAVASLPVGLVVLALHLLIAARFDNQLVGLGVGVLGTFVAVFASGLPDWAKHLTPWGYYALIVPAEYRGEDLVALSVPYLSVTALSIIGGALFIAATAALDRREV